VVLSAATSIWLPVSCERVFAFVRDENTRSQWDVLSHGNPVQEVSRIPNGSHPGNSISLLRVSIANVIRSYVQYVYVCVNVFDEIRA
jgi:homeobox-leucine zipper protein